MAQQLAEVDRSHLCEKLVQRLVWSPAHAVAVIYVLESEIEKEWGIHDERP